MKKQVIIAVAAISLLVLGGCSLGKEAASKVPNQSSEQASGGEETKAVKEIPVGDPKEAEGLEIAGVYFEAAEMIPEEKAGLQPPNADIHLEADIKATQGSKVGFGAGEWVPYLTVNYKLKNLDNGKEISGTFMPMNAADGPHYGANVKMSGAGKYKLSLSIESPEKQNYLLHVDKGSGVEGRFWTKPIEVEWEFPYMPKK